MKLLKDYVFTIQYDPGKANVLTDTLSKKNVSICSLAWLSVTKRPLAKEIQILGCKFIQLSMSERYGMLISIKVRSRFIQEIKDKQFEDENLNELLKKGVISKVQETTIDEEGVLSFNVRNLFSLSWWFDL